MLPYVVILGRTVSTYWIAGTTGLVCALIYAAVFAKRNNVTADDAAYILVYGALFSLLGAKILYLITVFPDFVHDLPMLASDPQKFIGLYITGGMVFYGGLIGAVAGAYYAARKFGSNWTDVCALLMPALCIIAGFGRIGCHMVGCCYGRPTNLPIGIIYTKSMYAPNGVKLLPVQLMEAGFDFILSFALYRLGQTKLRAYALEAYIITYGTWRFCIEFLRGDAVRGHLGLLSTSQWISLVLIAGAVIAARQLVVSDQIEL